MWLAMNCSLFIFHLILLSLVSCGSTSSLYDSDDPLWELNNKNFAQVVYGKSNAWIIEFYNVWCGHCIRYAPMWKQFARDIRTWRKVVDVAVVNCADSENLKLCRQYEANSYPTIQIFKANINKDEKGKVLEGNRDISSLEVSIIDFLETNWNENTPSSLPIIQPLENNNIKNVFTTLSHPSEAIILFIESPDSFVGRKVMMDMSFQDKVVIRRILTTNIPLLTNLKTTILNSSNLTVLKVYKNGDEESLFRFSKDTQESQIRDVIFEYFIGHHRNKSDEIENVPSPIHKGPFKQTVSIIDLENALHYALNQEIGIVKYIHGPRLDALKDFLYILKSYFPGSSDVKSFLLKVHNFAANQKNITGEEFVSKLQQLQDEKSNLPKMQDWVSCKGSQSKFRGYPCSLWTLFHTIAMQGYNSQNNVKNSKNKEEPDILQSIRGYVKYFFTCEQCSLHFQKMADNSEKISAPRDVVLWLWEAHNKVNQRLAGDITEDPKHPKVQFPTKDMCPKCRIEDSESIDKIKWNKDFILEFLQHFYGKQNIVMSVSNEDSSLSFERTESKNSAMVISFQNVSILERWNFQWFTNTDISLCVSLYIVSAILLVVIFFLFRQRKKRRKFQSIKYIHLCP